MLEGKSGLNPWMDLLVQLEVPLRDSPSGPAYLQVP